MATDQTELQDMTARPNIVHSHSAASLHNNQDTSMDNSSLARSEDSRSPTSAQEDQSGSGTDTIHLAIEYMRGVESLSDTFDGLERNPDGNPTEVSRQIGSSITDRNEGHPHTQLLPYTKPRRPSLDHLQRELGDSLGTHQDGRTSELEHLSRLISKDVLFKVPCDHRIPLLFNVTRFMRHHQRGSSSNSAHKIIKDGISLASERMNLRINFENAWREKPSWYNFCIIDHVKTPESNIPQQLIYQIDKMVDSATNDDNVEQPDPSYKEQFGISVAPWRRVILCKGLSMVSRSETPISDKDVQKIFPWIETEIPRALLMEEENASTVTHISVIEAIKLHMDCSKRAGGGRMNPYLDASRSFHITFYEILLDSDSNMEVSNEDENTTNFYLRGVNDVSRDLKLEEQEIRQESWRTGSLYINPGGSRKLGAPLFRRSAFTVLVATENVDSGADKARRPDLSPEWGTMLILCPSLNKSWYDLDPNKKEISHKWKYILEYNRIRIGEVAVIKEQYAILPLRWSRLIDYITNLLHEDFMDPESYTKLIFEDDQYSMAKKYIWILACIQDFRSYIVDNVSQWKMYRTARIDPFVSDRFPPELTALLIDIEQSCNTLDEIKSQMDDIVETVKARRDGLSNASALSESRHANRLGQNLKLLTYVSIFYLPLVFCAALWAIPNIELGGTRTAFIITAVALGLVNYLVVANLENIYRTLGAAYKIWKARMIQQMKNDDNEEWHKNGQRLEASCPERSMAPSEWLVLRYQVRFLGVQVKRYYHKTKRFFEGQSTTPTPGSLNPPSAPLTDTTRSITDTMAV